MSLLTNLFAGKPGAKAASSPETAPVKMNLEERMAFRREMLYECIKATLLASMQGYAPQIAIEFGRKVLYSGDRPSFSELEAHLKKK